MRLELSAHRRACTERIPKNDLAEQGEVSMSFADCSGMLIVAHEEQRNVLKASLIGWKRHAENLQITCGSYIRDTIDGYFRNCNDSSIKDALINHPLQLLCVEETRFIVRRLVADGADELQYPSDLHCGLHPLESCCPAALDDRVPESSDRTQCGQSVQRQAPPGSTRRRLPRNGGILRRSQHFHFHDVVLPRARAANIPPFPRGEVT